MTPARRLASTVLLCAAGAGLACYGITRTWSEAVTTRPGLSSLRDARTGADLEPWVLGLALVALAGSGALLATRGTARRLLGGLLALVGLGVAVGAIAGRAGLDVGSAGDGATFWPAACVLGGALIVVAGLRAVRDGHRWPAMGARYERRPAASGTGYGTSAGTGAASVRGAATGTLPGIAGGTAPSTAAGIAPGAAGAADGNGSGSADGRGAVPAAEPAPGAAARDREDQRMDTRAAWDALDRGDDPTR